MTMTSSHCKTIGLECRGGKSCSWFTEEAKESVKVEMGSFYREGWKVVNSAVFSCPLLESRIRIHDLWPFLYENQILYPTQALEPQVRNNINSVYEHELTCLVPTGLGHLQLKVFSSSLTHWNWNPSCWLPCAFTRLRRGDPRSACLLVTGLSSQ